jgi:L-ribulose-5-phosphate 3-epimerase
MMTRRTILKSTATLAAAAAMPSMLRAQAQPRLRIGSCVIGLEQARLAGLDGVEVGVGGAADQLQIADPNVRERYKEQMKKTGLVISSFMMGLFNSHPLASDPRGPAWLEQSIDAAQDLGARVILVAFFGKGSLLEGRNVKTADVDVVVERLKAAAPRAKDKGIILGIENTLSAQQNVEILQRVNNDAVQIYYDVYNTANMGYDVPAEIRFLREKIAIFHFKNGPQYLGEGKLQFDPIRDAMNDINYRGWIVLETSNPSKDGVADARKNAQFIRQLFNMG